MVAAGGYDESLRFAMDLDMFLRLRSRGRFVSTPRTVASYRWHPDALTVANAISARALAGDVYRAATVRTGKHVR